MIGQERDARAFVWLGTPALGRFSFRPGERDQPAKEMDMERSMQRLTRPLAAAALAAACAFGIPAIGAHAQSQAPMPNTSAQPKDVPDQKLDAAVAAMQQVASLRESYQQRLETAPPSDKERIADEANTALEKAVTDKGLSVDEYAEILAMAQADPVVRGKILQRIRPAEK
jgi:Domain of unknown function (DUF4168)